MSKRVLVPISTGFEEIEAITVVDILKRAGAEVVVAGVDGDQVTGRSNVTVIPDADLDTALAQGKYDLIVSNPPFHRGLRTDLGRARNLFEEAGRHLNGRGRLVVVVQTSLKLLPTLRECAGSVRTLAEDSRYRVLEAQDFGVR